ncbi:acylphosphatase-2-like [Amphibalanus amphitrite]|uniref:acylphosphatase-2-like n=1 Tax=Amphibalanus amphitrite TaxID=1232801 RepID=UPI001C90C79E|nr:acylphosphatase-2-like [Amphibalanus amphitrite]XP_043194490.1 acylphosphatase-2-like [Amphibalanus amphitrite]
MTLGDDPMISVDFEVFGHVQGCGYVKFLKEKCDELGATGWVKNTKQGTICGKLQARKSQVDEIVQWMEKTGSPGSQPERCDVSNTIYLNAQDFSNFSVRF